MAVTWQIRERVLSITINGDYAMEELVQAVAEGYRDSRFTSVMPILIDARRSTANPSEEAIRKGSRDLIGLHPGPDYSRWAIVVGLGPMRFRIARMASIAMEGLGVQMSAFTDLEDAQRWLLADFIEHSRQTTAADSRL